jgi:hypothetical protein
VGAPVRPTLHQQRPPPKPIRGASLRRGPSAVASVPRSGSIIAPGPQSPATPIGLPANESSVP